MPLLPAGAAAGDDIALGQPMDACGPHNKYMLVMITKSKELHQSLSINLHIVVGGGAPGNKFMLFLHAPSTLWLVGFLRGIRVQLTQTLK
jgi:hypothetical protein